MTRTFTPEELTAHLTDEQRQTIHDGLAAVDRVCEVVARELPAIVRAVHVAEANAVVDQHGYYVDDWWSVTDVGKVPARASECSEVLDVAAGRIDTDGDVEARIAELVSKLAPEAGDDAA